MIYDCDVVLMHKSLVEALRTNGVDNMEIYEAVVRSSHGRPPCHEYVAVNVVGALSAADMDNSDIVDASDGMHDVLFDSIAVDECRAMDQLMFRLAESRSVLLVHERVADALVESLGVGLSPASSASFPL